MYFFVVSRFSGRIGQEGCILVQVDQIKDQGSGEGERLNSSWSSN